MDNEATKILNPQQPQAPKAEQKEENVAQSKEKKGMGFGMRAAATAAGAAVGTSAAMAAEHIIQNSGENEEVNSETEAAGEEVQATPSEQEAIVTTDEGLHVAHVDDSLSFSEAFAEAREQVGAGGVFEWHGKVYGTYYENEWNSMSAAERAEWQSKVDYSDVTEDVAQHTSSEHHDTVEHVVTVKVEAPQDQEAASVPHDGTYIDPSTPEPTPASGGEDNEVHVVGIAVQDNGQGGVATLAGIQSGDDGVILVDVESDGRLDYAIHDDNGNGQIDNGEIHDISGNNMSTAQVVGAYVEESHSHGLEAVVTDIDSGDHYQITETEDGYGLASIDDAPQEGNAYLASNDDMPDYMNDADAGIMDA